MDHPHYRYRPHRLATQRARPAGVATPAPSAHEASTAGAGAQADTAGPLHAYVLLVLEHWEADPSPDDRRDPRLVGEFGSFTPDWRSWSQREYGLRIGVFRVLDALAAAGLTPAVAANARVLQRLPALVRQLDALGVEWVAHGESATRMMHAGMPLQAQRRLIEASVAAVTEATGRPPAGWLSQDWGTTPDTFELLAQAGLRYTLDWTNDDAPFALNTTPPLMAVPLSAEFDDVQCQWMRHLTPHDHARAVRTGFLRLRDEARASGTHAPSEASVNAHAVANADTAWAAPTRPVFGLALHPWLSGMSSRIGALRALLADLACADGVRWTTPGRIATSYCHNPSPTP